MIKVVVFDIDLLFDYKTANFKAIEKLKNYLCTRFDIEDSKFNLEYENLEYENLKCYEKEKVLENNRTIYFQNLLKKLGIESIKTLIEINNIYWKTILKEIELFDGILDIFNILRENNIKIMINNYFEENIQNMIIKKLKIDNLISNEKLVINLKKYKEISKKINILPEELIFIVEYTKAEYIENKKNEIILIEHNSLDGIAKLKLKILEELKT